MKNMHIASVLATSLLAFAGAAQALTVTVSAAWDPTNVAGSNATGISYTTAPNPLNANSSLSWNTATEVGIAKTFTFNQPFSVTVLDTAANGQSFHFYGTPVIFSGAGTAVAHSVFNPPLFTQGLYTNKTTSGVTFGYDQQGTVEYASSFGGQQMEWTARFLTQPTATVSFTNGTASYTWQNAQLEVKLLSAVPENGTAALLALGLAPLAIAARRRRRD